MNDGQKFAASVQAFMAVMLMGAVVLVEVLLLAVIFYLVYHKAGVDAGLAALLSATTNALINFGGIGVGFWLSRHRAQNGDGDDSNKPGAAPGPLVPSKQEKTT